MAVKSQKTDRAVTKAARTAPATKQGTAPKKQPGTLPTKSFVAHKVYRLDSAPQRGPSSAGIHHGGEDEHGNLLHKSVQLRDGRYTMPANLNPFEEQLLEQSLVAAGFQVEYYGSPEDLAIEDETGDYLEDLTPPPASQIGPPVGTEEELTPLDEIGDATWTFQHPDTNADGAGPTAEGIHIKLGGKEYVVDIKNGRVVTDVPVLKEYMLSNGYTLIHTEPKPEKQKKG